MSEKHWKNLDDIYIVRRIDVNVLGIIRHIFRKYPYDMSTSSHYIRTVLSFFIAST